MRPRDDPDDDSALTHGPPVGLGAVALDAHGGPARILHLSSGLRRLLELDDGKGRAPVGRDAEQVLGSDLWAALAAGVASQLEDRRLTVTLPGGRRGVVHWSVDDGTLLLAVEDVTRREQVARSLRQKALRDALTGLANRTLFLEHLEHCLHDSTRSDLQAAVAFVDVDDLKVVNESLGHAAGDELLLTVAHRLRRTLRASDVAGRLSGDEFAVIFTRLAGEREVLRVAERLMDTVTGPCLLGGRQIALSVSVGLALTDPRDPVSAPVLLGRADEALRRAKQRGKGRYVVFDEVLDSEVQQRNRIESQLRQATGLGQLRLVYQPVVDLRTGRVTGAEALLRWQHPTRGLLGPDDFLQAAEDSSAIIEMGAWVLDEACRRLAGWNAQLEDPLTLSVNVSARQLGSGDLPLTVEDALRRHGLPASAVRLEVTESVLTESATARRELWEMDASGVPVGIDDFGTGYASLTYLRELPVSFLKIDRSFVAGMTTDPARYAIVSSVASLAGALGIGVVAEGVETREQTEALLGLGCTSAQGFLYGAPVDGDDLLAAAQGPERSTRRPTGR